jgi:hypothetical protein
MFTSHSVLLTFESGFKKILAEIKIVVKYALWKLLMSKL